MREEIRNIITKLENTTRSQNDADDNYADFVYIIKQEMYQKVNYKKIKVEIGQSNKKRRTKNTVVVRRTDSYLERIMCKRKSYVKIRN